MIVRRGMYRAYRPLRGKSGKHLAIIDYDNSLNVIRPGWPVVFEIVPTGLHVRLLGLDEFWTLEQIVDRVGALQRIELLWRSPDRHKYDGLFNNCEHVANFIATGEFRSDQVREWMALAGLIGLVALLAREGRAA